MPEATDPWISRRTRTWATVAWIALALDLGLFVAIALASHGTVFALYLPPVWITAFIGWRVSRHLDIRDYFRQRQEQLARRSRTRPDDGLAAEAHT